MKKFQLLLRVFTSPIIFAIGWAGVLLFPLTYLIAFMGACLAIAKSFGADISESWESIGTMAFGWAAVPFMGTWLWITKAEFYELN